VFKLVIFDLDGTLYNLPNGASDFSKTMMYKEIKQKGIDFIALRLGKSHKEAAELRKYIHKKYDGDISIGLEKKYNLPRNEYFNYAWSVDLQNHIQANKKTVDIINSIKCKKAILSAAPEVWINKVLHRLKLNGLFDYVVSGDGDIRKPSLESYKAVLSHFEVKADETIMVDDTLSCLRAAKELDISTALIKRNRTRFPKYVDFVIEDLSSVTSILK
jgi:pyrimidine 5'-nucleotidase